MHNSEKVIQLRVLAVNIIFGRNSIQTFLLVFILSALSYNMKITPHVSIADASSMNTDCGWANGVSCDC